MTKVCIDYYKSPHRREKCVKLMVLKENLQKEEEKMMKKTDVVDQMIKKAAYHTAKKSANQICAFFFHQPKLPEAVRKLRKF